MKTPTRARSTKKPTAKKPPAKKPPAKKVPAAQARAAPEKRFGPRADLGAPVDPFFAKRSGPLRQILDELRALVEREVPGATASLKWGMPFYTLGGRPVCALAAFKAHVNLILAGPSGTFADPDGVLEGDGKTGRHLKLRTVDDLPREAVRGWLRAAARHAGAS